MLLWCRADVIMVGFIHNPPPNIVPGKTQKFFWASLFQQLYLYLVTMLLFLCFCRCCKGAKPRVSPECQEKRKGVCVWRVWEEFQQTLSSAEAHEHSWRTEALFLRPVSKEVQDYCKAWVPHAATRREEVCFTSMPSLWQDIQNKNEFKDPSDCSHWPEAICVLHLWEGLQNKTQPAGSSSGSHCWEAAQVLRVWAEFPLRLHPAVPQTSAHWRASFQMWRVWQSLHNEEVAPNAPGGPQRKNFYMWDLRSRFHPPTKPEKAPSYSHRWETLHL